MIAIHVYCPQGDEAIGQETNLPDTIINQLRARIDAAMKPDDLLRGKYTLGGLVQHCWIEGRTRMAKDSIGAQGFTAIPIKILVP